MPVDRRHVEFCSGAALDDRGEHAVVGIVLKREHASGTIREDHEVARGIGDHPRGDAAAHRFYRAAVGKGRCQSRITPGAAPHGGKDGFEIGYANEVDHFPGATEMFNSGDAEISQYRPLALGSNDALTFVDAALGERHERLAGQVTDRLAAVRATHDHEANVRVGNNVRDQTLDTEILGVQRADDGQFRQPGLATASASPSSLSVQTATGAW